MDVEKTIIKNKWNGRVKEISEKRSWNEIMDHFQKHVLEMAKLETAKEPERAKNKAHSLINLAAIAIKKMDIEYDLELIEYSNLLERIETHDRYLEEIRRKEEQAKWEAMRKKAIEDADNDTD